MSALIIGIDPGTRVSGLAVGNEDGKVLGVSVLLGESAPEQVKQIDSYLDTLPEDAFDVDDVLFFIEDQEFHGKTRVDPNNLLRLHEVTVGLKYLLRGENNRFPDLVTSTLWKGAVPKIVSQRRILTGLGWKWSEIRETYCVPIDCPFRADHPSHWREIVDAIGIMQYGAATTRIRSLSRSRIA